MESQYKKGKFRESSSKTEKDNSFIMTADNAIQLIRNYFD